MFISLSLCENSGVGRGQETVLYLLFVFLTVGYSIGQTSTDRLTHQRLAGVIFCVRVQRILSTGIAVMLLGGIQ